MTAASTQLQTDVTSAMAATSAVQAAVHSPQQVAAVTSAAAPAIADGSSMPQVGYQCDVVIKFSLKFKMML